MKKAIILGEAHEIIYCSLDSDYGQLDREEKKIYIDNGITDDIEIKRTILHEMFHALFTRLGLHNNLSDALEEIIVETSAHIIVENFDIKAKDDV